MRPLRIPLAVFHVVAALLSFAGVACTSCAACLSSDGNPTSPVCATLQGNFSIVDMDGTVRICRVVPLPKTVSAEAKSYISRQIPDEPNNWDLVKERPEVDKRRLARGLELLKTYPAKIESSEIAGVPVTRVIPENLPKSRSRLVLINVHGGAYELDCCSLVESIPVASLTGAEVVSVLYSLAPEKQFPVAIDEIIKVYSALLKDHAPSEIGIYGTSSGAVLTGEVAAKLKLLGIELPGALGIFSGFGDFGALGDSFSIFSGAGLAGHIDQALLPVQKAYVGATPLNDPILSPVLGDLHGWPPTLLMTSTRDWFLSGTSLFHRALLRAGVNASLVVFEALPHAFWTRPDLPESKEAYQDMAGFFLKNLKS